LSAQTPFQLARLNDCLPLG
jgi:hypothetical protein